MPTAHVTVTDFWLPRGKKRWVLKANDGNLFGVPESLSSQIQKGSSYNLIYKEDQWNGKTYLVVENIQRSLEPQHIPASTVPTMNAERQYASMQQPIRDEKSDDIAVLAIVKEWVGRIPVGDTGALAHALRSARAAWLQHKQPSNRIESGKPSLKDELNDELPETFR